jgi:DNA-binding transcriptional regulator LsrR (DeoR family)
MAEPQRASPDAIREQTIEIAKLYHQQGLSATEIMGRLPLRLRPTSIRTVYRRLANASKYVDIVVTPRDSGPPASRVRTNDDLSERLASELGLADAIVLVSNADETDDNAIHIRMGWLAARYVAGQIGDHDTIVVGSGRGVWGCVEALRPPAPAEHPWASCRQPRWCGGALGATREDGRRRKYRSPRTPAQPREHRHPHDESATNVASTGR